jgi:hypothetical protein
MSRVASSVGSSIVLLSILVASACSHIADDCEVTSTCGSTGGTTASGSTSGGQSGKTGGGNSSLGGAKAGEGGSSTAGATTTGGGGTSAAGEAGAAGSGGVMMLPCDGACTAPKPICDEPNNTCVECLEQADCAAGAKKKCDTDAKACVSCLESTDCPTAVAAKCNVGACVKCTTNDDCAHITGKTVCDTVAGECVQCTGKDYDSCGMDTGTPLVCDTLKRTCTTSKEHAADLCKACVSDANCKLGEACVLEKYDGKDVGYFCFWTQGDTGNGAPSDCFATGHPYAETKTNAVSIDGTTADICSLASSTCTAVSQFKSKNCKPDAAPDDSLCGFAPPKDAKCDQVGATVNYRCTMTCLSDEDCPGVSTCNMSTFVCDL